MTLSDPIAAYSTRSARFSGAMTYTAAPQKTIAVSIADLLQPRAKA